MGVRYGHSAEIGSRRVMEDRTVAVADIFKADATPSFRSRSEGFFPSSTIPSRNSSPSRSSDQDEAARRRFFPPGAVVQATPGAAAPAAAKTAVAGTGAVVQEDEGTAVLAATKEEKETAEGRGGVSGQAETQRSPPMSPSPSPSTPLCAAFFGVYDGHDGDVVAEALQKGLHKLIAKQVGGRLRRAACA